jgi:hypothetical protein
VRAPADSGRRISRAALVLDWVNDHNRIHERGQRSLDVLAQTSELRLCGIIQLPPVHVSDAVPGADLLPGYALCGGWRALLLVAIDTCQELPVGIGVAPGGATVTHTAQVTDGKVSTLNFTLTSSGRDLSRRSCQVGHRY